MANGVQSHVLSIRGYILLWILTILAPLGNLYYSFISPLWLASIDPYSNQIEFFLLGVRIVGEGPSLSPIGLFPLWIAIPSFYANINIWNLDRRKNSPADASWMAWLTTIAFLFVFGIIFFSDFITAPIPIPITAVVQHLLFKRIYKRSRQKDVKLTG